MGSLRLSKSFSSVSGLKWAGVEYFCTQRVGGFSRGAQESFNLGLHVGDDEALVLSNRQRLRETLPSEPLWLNQVHGTDVLDADEAARLPAGQGFNADAVVTTTPGQVLVIMTADCLPVVFATADGSVLAAAHAGWRGLAGGILENTVARLRQKSQGLGLDIPRIRAWIGPGISQTHFEVGAEVYDAFTIDDPAVHAFFVEKIPGRKWHADLAGLARLRLHRAGVENIQLSGECTYTRSDLYYSYRRDPHTGRMATLAWIKPESLEFQ